MRYEAITQATFLDRPNRFIARVLSNHQELTVHVKNTGRCRELFLPGVPVWIQKAQNPARKTAYDLICVEKNGMLINVDSAAPNQIFCEWAAASGYFGSPVTIKPEQTFGQSRLDFYLEHDNRRIYAEVKGCTLEENGVCRFPDAPTERGIKHIHELIHCRREGYEACIAFIIQLENARYFEPNDRTFPIFRETLRLAKQAGVEILALSCHVTPETIAAADFIPVHL